MRRIIRSSHHSAAAVPKKIDPLPDRIMLSIEESLHRTVIEPTVKPDTPVQTGDVIAAGPYTCLHSPLEGRIGHVHPDSIEIIRTGSNTYNGSPCTPPKKDQWPDFLRGAGLTGMGGSMFPYARKISAAIKAKVHTLVINTVECEPGVEIDEAIMLHEQDRFLEGVKAVTAALNISRRVMAIRVSRQKFLSGLMEKHGFEPLIMPDSYPAGAAKLIVSRLTGKLPATGVHNSALGYLVMCSTSLWALGNFMRTGRPSIDRPLTVSAPGTDTGNLIVPIGTPVEHILKACGISWNADRQLLVAQGRMMGHAVSPQDTIHKGTLALFVVPKNKRLIREESPCILCGSCFDACPLHLHPISMAERIRAGTFPDSLQIQLKECFLCGACAAVCPADIPLTDLFRKGKQCIREQQNNRL